MNSQDVQAPEQLPFLQAICWQGGDVRRLSPEQALDRYERGWQYLNVLGELSAEERVYVGRLAQAFGSWIRV